MKSEQTPLVSKEEQEEATTASRQAWTKIKESLETGTRTLPQEMIDAFPPTPIVSYHAGVETEEMQLEEESGTGKQKTA